MFSKLMDTPGSFEIVSWISRARLTLHHADDIGQSEMTDVYPRTPWSPPVRRRKLRVRSSEPVPRGPPAVNTSATSGPKTLSPIHRVWGQHPEG